MIMAAILKIGIEHCLEQKGLDPQLHVTQNVNLVTQKNKERIRKGRGHRKHTQVSKSPLSDVFLDDHDSNDPMPVLDSEANTGLTDELDVYGLDVDYNVDNVNVLDTIDTNDLFQPEPGQHEEEALLASSEGLKNPGWYFTTCMASPFSRVQPARP